MEEQEISLRELIEVLLKNKTIIIGITIICILISGVLSYFVIEPTYEAEAKILVSDMVKKQPQIEGIENIIDNLSNYPGLTVESYKDHIKNPVILEKVRSELKLDPEEYSLESLRNSIEVENPKNTNIIKIKIKNNDPELAKNIANSVAVNFTNFITDLAKKQATKSLEYVENQLNIEEKNLNKAMVEYKKFLQQPRGVFELESEQSSKIALLTKYKEKLAQTDIDLEVIAASLQKTKDQLEETKMYIVTTKSLTDDPILFNYANEEKNKSTLETMQLEMKSEEINPVYIALKERLAELEIRLTQIKTGKISLDQKIAQTQKELEKLQVELAEKKHQKEILNRKVNMAQKTYNALMDKYEESRIAQSSKVGETAVVISSRAIIPEKPVSPKKALNLAIAAVLGMMLGVFIAFFKAYWESTTETLQATKGTGLSNSK